MFWELWYSIGTVCHELCKNGWTDRDAVWVVDPGAEESMCCMEGTLAPPDEYDWTVRILSAILYLWHMRSRPVQYSRGLMSLVWRRKLSLDWAQLVQDHVHMMTGVSRRSASPETTIRTYTQVTRTHAVVSYSQRHYTDLHSKLAVLISKLPFY